MIHEILEPSRDALRILRNEILKDFQNHSLSEGDLLALKSLEFNDWLNYAKIVAASRYEARPSQAEVFIRVALSKLDTPKLRKIWCDGKPQILSEIVNILGDDLISYSSAARARKGLARLKETR